MTEFTSSEWLRYTRHLQLPQFGVVGQQQLKQSRVSIVGAGGLGSPVSLYLAAAGVGHITIVDGDTIDLTNLQRQILFTTEQVGLSKAECARERLSALNPEIELTAVSESLSTSNADDLFDRQDLIMDCTDNFATRYLINDSCVKKNIPWLFASIYQFSGQCALFTPNTACFRCLFPEPPEGLADCNDAGVIGVLPGLLGTLQANEALKYLAGLSCPLHNSLLLVEALDLSFRRIQLAKNLQCRVCGTNKHEIDTTDYQLTCKVSNEEAYTLSVAEYKRWQAEDRDYQLLDVRTQAERAAFHIGGDHLPLDQLKEKDLTRDKLIICYCHSGQRSQAAVEQLRQVGIEAYSLQGGIAGYLNDY